MRTEKRTVSSIARCLWVLLFLVTTSTPAFGQGHAPIPKNAGPAWSSLFELPGYPLPRTPIAPSDFGIIVEKNVAVPMRDGVVLRANVYRPDTPGKYPVLMTFTSFHKDLPGW